MRSMHIELQKIVGTFGGMVIFSRDLTMQDTTVSLIHQHPMMLLFQEEMTQELSISQTGIGLLGINGDHDLYVFIQFYGLELVLPTVHHR